MSANLFPLMSYVLISTFTPGPSNISSASIAIQTGYKNTLNYQAGLAAGVLLMMLLSGWISAMLLSIFPALEPLLRYVGAGYILYLAFRILKVRYSVSGENLKPFRFADGLILNTLNPKLIVYSLTLFSGFLAPITTDKALVALAALLLAATSFGATSMWAIFGTTIETYLHNPRIKAIVNILLSLSLVYTAIELTGLI